MTDTIKRQSLTVTHHKETITDRDRYYKGPSPTVTNIIKGPSLTVTDIVLNDLIDVADIVVKA